MYIANSVIDGNTFESGSVRIGNAYQEDRLCDNIRVINNIIYGTLELAINSSLIAYNTFSGQGSIGLYFNTVTNGTAANLRIVGNSFDNCSQAIITRSQHLNNVIITENVFTNIIYCDMQLLGTNYVIVDNIPCKGVAGSFELIS